LLLGVTFRGNRHMTKCQGFFDIPAYGGGLIALVWSINVIKTMSGGGFLPADTAPQVL